MGLKFKGRRRAAAASVVLLLTLVLAPFVASAQIDDNQVDLERAEGTKEQADGLVTAALANRAEVEAQLLATLENYQNLAFQLSSVSTDLARLSDLIDLTGAALVAARQSVDRQGVEAYMQALSLPGGIVWSSDSIEDAMVADRTLAILAGVDEDEAAALAVSERDLRALDQQYQTEFQNVESLASQVEAEAARLQELFALADLSVAAAIGEALAADAAYRSALDDVEQARAAEEELERQAERGTTTTTTAAAATSSTDVATPVSTTIPGSIARPIKPAVEQWRPLVASFFSPGMVDQALSIIQCESLGDPNAYNPYSGASGLFQFIPGTWAVTSVKAGFGGSSVFDPEANIASAAWLASYYQGAGLNPWTPWHCTP
ncbi:MAG TPA: transglycosylase SLT domain-containing protein [Acidimicrobiia bacterium]|nr:transglycosylase SLT domain-containing protein [Acidimicrobiia bacterium]